ncbi:hypothetical protein JKJ11_07650 [Vibrio sp. SCSIO 43133]|uniref:hypothetical protein n=1 Tax=Vibrio sp. SCSIO 43133 TaxID=2802577 RepID=UPI00207598A0|nr:hypothetical protein [Vibrio sp. SCSIO 43133]USE01921.1 hypothetical protein JKJ11_07650 [Vibrio sp. SCSIO 43133]
MAKTNPTLRVVIIFVTFAAGLIFSHFKQQYTENVLKQSASKLKIIPEHRIMLSSYYESEKQVNIGFDFIGFSRDDNKFKEYQTRYLASFKNMACKSKPLKSYYQNKKPVVIDLRLQNRNFGNLILSSSECRK